MLMKTNNQQGLEHLQIVKKYIQQCILSFVDPEDIMTHERVSLTTMIVNSWGFGEGNNQVMGLYTPEEFLSIILLLNKYYSTDKKVDQ